METNKEIKAIDKMLKDTNINEKMKKQLEKKKEILLNNKTIIK